MKTLLTILLALVLNGCGAEPAASSAKDLFSSWADSTTGVVLDLSTLGFGTGAAVFALTGGEQCASTLVIGGTQSSASVVILGSVYVSGTGAGTDPGCVAFDGSYALTKTDTELTVCDGTECSTYR